MNWQITASKWWFSPSALFNTHDTFCEKTIKYVMFKVHDLERTLYNNAVGSVMCEGWYFDITWKHLHDRIISLRGEVLAHKTSLTAHFSALKLSTLSFSIDTTHYRCYREQLDPHTSDGWLCMCKTFVWPHHFIKRGGVGP